jgi:periplasmic divalent cation tolerance protein
MTDKIVVFSTCGSAEEAQKVARALVEAKLAACVNIVPGVQSIYEWHGAVENAPEWLLVIKSRRDLFARLTAELRRIHSYEVPEAVAIHVVDGLPEYLSWMDSGLSTPAESPDR